MAEILRLPQRRRHEPPASAPTEPDDRKVLFFTGVRYHRAETPAPPEKRSREAGKTGKKGKSGPTGTRPRARRA